jgi:hypothetical protein
MPVGRRSGIQQRQSVIGKKDLVTNIEGNRFTVTQLGDPVQTVLGTKANIQNRGRFSGNWCLHPQR